MPRSEPKSRNDDAVLVVAQAIAQADAGIPGPDERGPGVWAALDPTDHARYLMMARVGVDAYLAWVGDART